MVATLALMWLLTGFGWRHVRLKTLAVAFVVSEGLLVMLRWVRSERYREDQGPGARGLRIMLGWVRAE
jgi:hypothetical protein